MRKSTLITTIAMIVVVVVALSTATYAWFTSASVNEATQTIATTSAGDWLLQIGTLGDTGVDVTWSTNEEILTLERLAGLKAPDAAITTNVQAISSAAETGATVVSRTIPFIECLKSGAAAKYKQKYDVLPTLLRAQNPKATTQELHLTVLINAGSGDGVVNRRRAGAALTFVLIVTDMQGTKTLFTNGYGIASKTNSDAYKNNSNAWGLEGEGVVADTAAEKSNSAEKPNYGNSGNNNGQMYTVAASAITATGLTLGISQNDNYMAYDLTIGSVNSNEAVSMALYTWVDGWTADDGATSAELNIKYMFTTGAISALEGVARVPTT